MKISRNLRCWKKSNKNLKSKRKSKRSEKNLKSKRKSKRSKKNLKSRLRNKTQQWILLLQFGAVFWERMEVPEHTLCTTEQSVSWMEHVLVFLMQTIRLLLATE